MTMQAFFVMTSPLVLVLLVKFIIQLSYFVVIFNCTKILLENLSKNEIFVDANSALTKKIGVSFIYLSVTEIIVGFVLGIIMFLSGTTFKEFRLELNTMLIMFIVIGLILLIVSFILEKAIEIYKENSLTI